MYLCKNTKILLLNLSIHLSCRTDAQSRRGAKTSHTVLLFTLGCYLCIIVLHLEGLFPAYSTLYPASGMCGCLSTAKNNTAKVLCTNKIPIKHHVIYHLKCDFVHWLECLSLKIFSFSAHDCFHNFFEIKIPFLNNEIYCHFIMVAGIYKMIFFFSPPLHT